MATYTKDNKKEIPDNTPVELPIGYRVPETLESMIARLITNSQFNQARHAAGEETFEEADDFDTDEDEPDFTSSHQMTDMQEEFIHVKPERTQATSPDTPGDPGSIEPDSHDAPDEPETRPTRKAKAKAQKSVAKSDTVDNEAELA